LRLVSNSQLLVTHAINSILTSLVPFLKYKGERGRGGGRGGGEGERRGRGERERNGTRQNVLFIYKY
jgi:hypothetical protein